MYQRQVRGLAVSGLLCAALGGCGSAVASSQAASPPASAAQAGTAQAGAGAAQVGCASVNQATTVTVRRVLRLVEPVANGSLGITEHKPALVRTLFGDFCRAVTHPAIPKAPMLCPADFGTEYAGTFYDGNRVLATFTYAASGCQRVSITAAGKTRTTMVVGAAAAAAPHLQADLAAVLGLPKPGVIQPQAQVNPGGPNK